MANESTVNQSFEPENRQILLFSELVQLNDMTIESTVNQSFEPENRQILLFSELVQLKNMANESTVNQSFESENLRSSLLVADLTAEMETMAQRHVSME